jgi:hypothetical protein
MPAAPLYESWLSGDLPPPWLRKPRFAELLYVLGQMFDALAEAAKVAVKSRFPYVAPVDALRWIGAERVLERYPVDTDATYRARLAAAWELYELQGTAAGVVAALNAAGFDNVALYDVHAAPAWYVGAWPPSDTTANWSRFWVEINPGALDFAGLAWRAWRWGAAPTGTGLAWGPGHTWGSTATLDQIRFVRRILRRWKPAHTVCAGIYVRMAGKTVRWAGM